MCPEDERSTRWDSTVSQWMKDPQGGTQLCVQWMKDPQGGTQLCVQWMKDPDSNVSPVEARWDSTVSPVDGRSTR